MLNLFPLTLIISAYFIGSVPFGLVIGKLWGIDNIRKYGSGNIGATNVTRIAGKKAGLLTLLLDGGKGAIMVELAKIFSNNEAIIYLVAAIVTIGHIFPIWLRFKGGKGVATTIALLLVINWMIGLATILIWLITFAIWRISGLAAIIAFIALPLTSYLLQPELKLLYLMIFLASLVLTRHKDNIKNLLSPQ